MKLTMLFFFFALIQVSATSVAQQTKLSLKFENQSLESIFNQIEESSQYSIFYKNELIENSNDLSGEYRNEDIFKILDKILETENLTYTVKGKLIMITSSGESVETSYINQQQTVIGKITNTNGEAIPGVTVIVKGTTQGAVTDIDGQYTMRGVPSDGTLVFSFIGLKTVEVLVNNRSQIDVVMEEDAIGMDEVVVVGFGERRKKDLTGSISTVQAEDLEKMNSVSPQFALQGNTTGVRIVNTSGDPNAAPQIFVRGIGTWQGSAQPLYVIDGQTIMPPTSGNEDVISGPNRDTPPNLWSLINPNDIESISVLKDASAAAIYGSRGANGVILITTKKGKKGGATIEFNAQTGVQNIPTYDMLNTQQYVDLVQEMYANNLNPDVTIENNLYGRGEDNLDTRLISYSPQFDPQSPYYISDRTTYDWQDELIRSNAIDQYYDLKVSGASDNTDYYVSVGYKNQESVFYGGGMERFTAAINLNTQVNKWLKVGVNYKFAYQNTDLDDYSDLPGIADVVPWQPLYDPTSKSGYAEVIYATPSDWAARKIYGQGSNQNFLAMANLQRRDFVLQRNMGQAFIEITPLQGLTLRGSLNLDNTSQDRQLLSIYANNIFSPVGNDPATEAPDAANSLGSYGTRRNYILNYQSDFNVTYDRTFGKHRITATAVVQDQYNRRNLVNLSGDNLLVVKDFDKIQYSNDLANNSSIFSWDEKFWFGMVGRINYIFDEKYYLDASFRRDASSGFDKDYRWGNFYSVSGAWRISSEAFMENITWLDDLKIKAGWGEAGNDETVVGRYGYLSGVNSSGSYRLGSGNGDPLGIWQPGSIIADFPNVSLTWEVAATTNVGFDALMFNNKLSTTVEVFTRKTSGIQQRVQLPYTVGTNDPLFNIGELTNKGLDIMVGYNNRIGDFTYAISGNISFLTNEVTKLYGGQPLDTDYGRVEEGRPIGHLWGYKTKGIFQTQAEVDEYFATTPEPSLDQDYVGPGDYGFQDIGSAPTEDEPFYSTTPDSLIDTYDRTEIGHTIPGYHYGINLNAGWKGFDVSLSFYGEGDVDKDNSIRRQFESMSGGTNHWTTTLDRWTSTNPSTTMPRAVVGDPAGNNRFSDRYVESAAFFRLNTWQLGYTISDRILQKVDFAVKSLRIYVSGQNNIYLFKWSGIDPVNDSKPLPKTLNIGLKAKF